MPAVIPALVCWCPAYGLPDAERLARARERTQALAGPQGWTVVEAPSLTWPSAPSTWPPAEDRIAELRALWSHDILLAARGGYGCVDLLPALPASANAPLLIGYSDLTVLHAAWWRRGWGVSLYGYMPATPGGPRALASTLALLRGDELRCDGASDPRVRVAQPGDAEGPCFAACLRVLTALCGTPEQPDLAGAILAIEDIDERAYRIERDLQQLHASGTMRGVRGLVFGTFRADEPPGYGGPAIVDLARTWGRRLGVPTVVGLPFGHEADPVTLACGRMTRLRADATTWKLVQASADPLPARRS